MIVPKQPTNPQQLSLRAEHARTIALGGYDTAAKFDWLTTGSRCTTACWTFKGGHHEISISMDCYTHISLPHADIKSNLTSYLKSLYRHERGHALYTARDLKWIQGECVRREIPFDLVNLFEDARIEALMRKEQGVKFRWSNWEQSVIKSDDPVSMFFALIHAENSLVARRAVRAERIHLPSGRCRYGSNVEYYYKAALASRSTTALLDVVARFMHIFEIPKSPKPMGGIPSHAGSGDMAAAAEASDAPPSDSDGTSVAGPDKDDKDSKGGRGITQGGRASSANTAQKDCTVKSGWNIEQRKNYCEGAAVNLTEAQTVTAALQSMHDRGRGKALSDHGKRVSMHSLATMRYDKLFIGKAESNKAKPRILVITDMSGSMGGTIGDPFNHAMTINYGIARSKAVDSVHLFTSKHAARRLEQHEVTIDELNAAGSHSSSEGIGSYIQRHAHKGLASEYAAILCITDGDLTDCKPDWSLLERKGLTRIAAVYVGDRDQSKELKRHFKKHLSAKTVREIASRIRQLLM